MSDPILAQTEVLAILQLFRESFCRRDKVKSKRLLLNASKKAMSQEHTYVSAIYREADRKSVV